MYSFDSLNDLRKLEIFQRYGANPFGYKKTDVLTPVDSIISKSLKEAKVALNSKTNPPHDIVKITKKVFKQIKK